MGMHGHSSASRKNTVKVTRYCATSFPKPQLWLRTGASGGNSFFRARVWKRHFGASRARNNETRVEFYKLTLFVNLSMNFIGAPFSVYLAFVRIVQFLTG